MKHLKTFEHEFNLLNHKRFLHFSLPCVSLIKENGDIDMYNPSENEVVLYFETTTPQDGSHDVDLVLWDGTIFSPGQNAHVYYDGKDVTNTIDWDMMSSTDITLTVDTTKRDIHQVIVKGDGVTMNGDFLGGTHAIAVDYPKNTGKNYKGLFIGCPNLSIVRLMNKLPDDIQIGGPIPDCGRAGTIIYNDKYDYTPIRNSMPSGWTLEESSSLGI